MLATGKHTMRVFAALCRTPALHLTMKGILKGKGEAFFKKFRQIFHKSQKGQKIPENPKKRGGLSFLSVLRCMRWKLDFIKQSQRKMLKPRRCRILF